MKKTIIIAVFISAIISFAVGFSIAWVFKNGIHSLLKEDKDNTAIDTSFIGENALAVSDQVFGTRVIMDVVTFKKEGWIAVHEEDSAGNPGNILGARLFAEGETIRGEIELLRPTKDGKSYYAMLHAEDGDHQFDFKKDMPLKDPFGNMLMMKFSVFSEKSSQ